MNKMNFIKRITNYVSKRSEYDNFFGCIANRRFVHAFYDSLVSIVTECNLSKEPIVEAVNFEDFTVNPDSSVTFYFKIERADYRKIGDSRAFEIPGAFCILDRSDIGTGYMMNVKLKENYFKEAFSDVF